MRSAVHVGATAAGMGALWWFGAPVPAIWASGLTGVLLDLDHIPEYLLAPRTQRSWRDFQAFWSEFEQPRLYTPAHAWEWLALLLGWAVLQPGTPVLAGLAFGLAHHLVLDQIGNRVRPLTYSVLWRWRQGFSSIMLLQNWRSSPLPWN